MTAKKKKKKKITPVNHAFGDVMMRAVQGPHTVSLREGDSAPNPASTKTRIYGPGQVQYTYHCGSFRAEILKGCSVW